MFKKEFKNSRGISVAATIERLYGRLIEDRLGKDIEMGEEQSGFFQVLKQLI